jgi:hypothetical protein
MALNAVDFLQLHWSAVQYPAVRVAQLFKAYFGIGFRSLHQIVEVTLIIMLVVLKFTL